MGSKYTILIFYGFLLVVIAVLVSCSTKPMPAEGDTEIAILPDDFSEMVGNPSFTDSYAFLTYITKEGEYKTQKYTWPSLGSANKIIWVKPESQNR